MRRRDLRGANEWRGIERVWVICCRMVAREAGWKMRASSSWVIKRVLDGGAGWESGGKELRSIESGDLGPRDEMEEGDVGDFGGDGERQRVVVGD